MRKRAEGRDRDLPEATEASVGQTAVPLSNQMLLRAMTQPGDALERDAEAGGPVRETDRGGGLLPRSVVESLAGAGRPLDGATMASMQQRFGRDFSQVRVHTDGAAARSAEQVGAAAYTVGSDIVLGAGRYAPGTAGGDRLLGHELAHVVQGGSTLKRFHLPHGTHQGAKYDETSKIAGTYAAMLSTIQSIIAASVSYGTTVNMDKFVENCGGTSAGRKISKTLGSDMPTVKSMLLPRYLLTSRAGLLDMRHFFQLLYISHFVSSVSPGTNGNRSATRQGREHELEAESESRFGAEDATSNAIGAYTGSRLAGLPQSDDLLDTIKDMLDRCDPVDFTALSGTSQSAILHFYGDLVSDPKPKSPGDMIPANQNESAVPPLLTIPEFAGKERSFPFVIDPDDPKTITDTDFLKGALSVDDDDDVREYTYTQRPEVIKLLTPQEKVRMAELAFEGWVADGDIDAIEVLYKNSTLAEKALIRKAIDPSDLTSGDQEARLEAIFAR
ncbi:DUF4157 domain-containing protein [Actinoplanes sp. CA-142083]|uniref:eCIS core domain-containing protein n=1 Tax=Actinoplanes sp. CA-142083 TaxID=3239903 RepID=UPI003D902211